MTVSAHDVAVALRERRPGLDRLQIQKLLYFCQGHHLADLNEPIFDDAISAWEHGPVVAYVWKVDRGEVPPPPVGSGALGTAQLNTVEYVLQRYGRLSGSDMRAITHDQQPWQRGDHLRRAHCKKSARIEVEWIRDYFVTARAEEEKSSRLDTSEVRSWLSNVESRRAAAGQAVADDLDAIRALLSKAGG